MTEWQGRSAAMRESPWLASEDIDGLGDVIVTIETVHKDENVEFELGRTKPVVYSVKFKGHQRKMIVNGVNRKTLVNFFGVETKNWLGKSITLYVKDGVKVGKEMKKGIRIRQTLPSPQGKTEK